MDTLLLTTPDTAVSPSGSNVGWDVMLDANGNIAVATGGYALAQDAASEIKTFQGEVYYDTTKGIPYSTQVLGIIPPSQILKSFMINAALLVPGVVSAAVFWTSFINRKLSGQVQTTDESGNTTVAFF